MVGPLQVVAVVVRILLFLHWTRSFLPLIQRLIFPAVVPPILLFDFFDHLITWLLDPCNYLITWTLIGLNQVVITYYQHLLTARQYVRPRLSRIRHYHLMRKSRRRRPIRHAHRKILKRPKPSHFVDEDEDEGFDMKPFSASRRSIRKFLRKVDALKHYHQLRQWLPTGFCFPSTRQQCCVVMSGRPFAASAQQPPDVSKTTRRARKRGKKREYPIVLDTGSSWSISPFLADFVTEITTSPHPTIGGVDSDIQVHGVGFVEWEVEDIRGVRLTIRTQALYVPSAKIRLFSPQSYFKENLSGRLTCDHRNVELHLADEGKLVFPYNDGSNLPLMLRI